MSFSHTLYHRADGTVSSIVRRETVIFTGPKGETFPKDMETPVTLEDVSDIVDPAYAAFDAHNQNLEAQIVTERDTAAAEKADALRAASEATAQALAAKDNERAAAIAAKDAERADAITEKDRIISEKAAEIARIRAEQAAELASRDAAIAARDAALTAKDAEIAAKDAELAARVEAVV